MNLKHGKYCAKNTGPINATYYKQRELLENVDVIAFLRRRGLSIEKIAKKLRVSKQTMFRFLRSEEYLSRQEDFSMKTAALEMLAEDGVEMPEFFR